jgi:hypothetical protein
MNSMKKNPNLEDALKNALRREDAPDSFVAHVLASVAQKKTVAHTENRNWFSLFSQPLVRWVAFAAVSIGLVIGGVHYRNVQRERAEGEAAKQQLMLALRIAGSKLQLAKEKVKEINQPQTHPQPKPARSRS